MSDRKPLVHIPGKDNLPPGLSDQERQAATNAPVVVPPPATGNHKPLVPLHLVPIALALGALLIGASTIAPQFFADLPAWMPVVGATLGLIAFYLGGQGAPDFSPGRPIVPLTLVPVCLTAATALGAAAAQATDPRVQAGLLAGAALVSWLAGKKTPQPMVER